MDEHTFISLYKSMVRPHVEGHYDLRKHFFTMRKVNIWNSLPNSVVHASTVNAFKARLSAHLYYYHHSHHPSHLCP